jgi:enamine deaminase RidA (YjgF/YER057c/UK114 family)
MVVLPLANIGDDPELIRMRPPCLMRRSLIVLGRGYSMVMEVDGRIELSGQGGWDPATLEFPEGRPIEAEFNQAFENVAFMLNAAGLGDPKMRVEIRVTAFRNG